MLPVSCFADGHMLSHLLEYSSMALSSTLMSCRTDSNCGPRWPKWLGASSRAWLRSDCEVREGRKGQFEESLLPPGKRPVYYWRHRIQQCFIGIQLSSICTIYQDSDSITQSELMRMMNDNSKDEEIQVGNYSSYIPTELVHGPRHA